MSGFPDDRRGYMIVLMVDHDGSATPEEAAAAKEYEWLHLFPEDRRARFFDDRLRSVVGGALGAEDHISSPPIKDAYAIQFEAEVLSARHGATLLWDIGDLQVWRQSWHHAEYLVVVRSDAWRRLYDSYGPRADSRAEWDALLLSVRNSTQVHLERLRRALTNGLLAAGARVAHSWSAWTATWESAPSKVLAPLHWKNQNLWISSDGHDTEFEEVMAWLGSLDPAIVSCTDGFFGERHWRVVGGSPVATWKPVFDRIQIRLDV
jgi:hypothetical protein